VITTGRIDHDDHEVGAVSLTTRNPGLDRPCLHHHQDRADEEDATHER
jgi:hypothetical protein